VSASCGSPNSSSSSPSPLFDIGKKPDAMANFVYINVLMTVVYLIILLVFYNYYDTIPTWGMLILCVPLLIYLFGFKTGKKKKSKKKKSKKKKNKKQKEKMENIEEGFKSKKRKSKKTKPIKIKINYSEFLKYTTIGAHYSFIVVSLILLMELYKKMNNINMTFFTLFLQFGKDSWDGVLNWIKNFFKSSSWAGDALIYDILKPVFNAIASILIIISLLWGSIELFFKKIIKS
jgi:ABC-type multidrug transport system fused ATPase/permease subunit